MRQFPVILFLLSCFSFTVSGRSGDGTPAPLRELEEKIASSEISFSYDYRAEAGKVVMTGQGSAVLQGESFFLTVDGMEIYCDGVTRWTLDRGAKEMVIETFDPDDADFSANPALLLSRSESFFDMVSQSSVTIDGENLLEIRLVPRSYPRLKSVILYFSAGNASILKKVTVTSSDGTVTDFNISDFAYKQRGDASRFIFDISALDDDWIVTDLR